MAAGGVACRWGARAKEAQQQPHLRASLVAPPIDCARSSCCWPWLRELASDWAVVRLAASWEASLAGSDSEDLEACRNRGERSQTDRWTIDSKSEDWASRKCLQPAVSACSCAYRARCVLCCAVLCCACPASQRPATRPPAHPPTCRCSSKPAVKAVLICWNID